MRISNTYRDAEGDLWFKLNNKIFFSMSVLIYSSYSNPVDEFTEWVNDTFTKVNRS